MMIRFLQGSSNARGTFPPGTVVDWPVAMAQPFLDAGIAEPVEEPSTKPVRRKKVKEEV